MALVAKIALAAALSASIGTGMVADMTNKRPVVIISMGIICGCMIGLLILKICGVPLFF